MRPVIGWLAVLLLAAGAADGRADVDLAQRKAESRATVKAFAEALKDQLVQALESGGPAAAIAVCSVAAPAIAAERSQAHGMQVARTSLRVRNPANAPDPWEAAVLQDFEARKAAGEDPATLEHLEVVAEDGRRVFRYMKAIPTQELCLECHGGALDPAVAAKLRELYPEDRATGFAVGDLRGAFTVRQPM